MLGLRYHRCLLPPPRSERDSRSPRSWPTSLSRTRGLLGLEETATTNEAVLAMVAEAIVLVTLVPVAFTELRASTTSNTLNTYATVSSRVMVAPHRVASE